MRTLVVSDLHLGALRGRAVLDDPGCRRSLCDAVAQAQRLVLLGDVVELRERPLREAVADALPVLSQLAEALAAGAEVVVLTGNHDHRLVAPWLTRRDRGTPLGTGVTVDAGDGEPLADVVAALGAARTRVLHPGASLSEDVWATHGHYGDRHTTVPILERLSAGVMARIVGQASGPQSAEDYEAALAPVYAWIDAIAEHGRADRDLEGSERAWLALSSSGGGVRRRALRAGFPLAIVLMNRAGIGPLHAQLGRGALRTGPLVAMGEVAARLGVHAPTVLFGHTHRAGPLPGDDPAEWRTPAGAQLMNTGCWVRVGALLGGAPSASPYRAGFAVWLDSAGGPPRLVNLLD